MSRRKNRKVLNNTEYNVTMKQYLVDLQHSLTRGGRGPHWHHFELLVRGMLAKRVLHLAAMWPLAQTRMVLRRRPSGALPTELGRSGFVQLGSESG